MKIVLNKLQKSIRSVWINGLENRKPLKNMLNKFLS